MKIYLPKDMFFNASPEIYRRARELRDNMTSSEIHLWKYLSNNKLDGFRFKPQHPIGNFIVDFYCHKAKLVIELDGEIHLEEEQKERDQGRTAEIEAFGLTIIRFTNQEVLEDIDNVLIKINTIIQKNVK